MSAAGCAHPPDPGSEALSESEMDPCKGLCYLGGKYETSRNMEVGEREALWQKGLCIP